LKILFIIDSSLTQRYAIMLSNHGDLVLFKKSITTCVHMIYIIIKVNTWFFSAFFYYAKTRFLQMSRYYPIF